MRAAMVERAGEPIRVDLTVPVLRIGFGPFALDPIEQMIGARLCDLLEPLLAGPVIERASEGGARVEVYPLALPDGEGAVIPLGGFGELGFANLGGLLVLTVPWAVAGWLRQGLGEAIVRGPEARWSDEGARVAEVGVRLRPGMRARVPLGALGECGLEAA